MHIKYKNCVLKCGFVDILKFLLYVENYFCALIKSVVHEKLLIFSKKLMYIIKLLCAWENLFLCF